MVATSGWGTGGAPMPGTPPLARENYREPCSGSSISLHGKPGAFCVPLGRVETSA